MSQEQYYCNLLDSYKRELILSLNTSNIKYVDKNEVRHDESHVTSRSRDINKHCAVAKCGEKSMTRQKRRRSSEEHRHIGQTTHNDFQDIYTTS